MQERRVILFENQIQTTSASPCRTQVQPAASFLVCSLIFIEYKQKVILDSPPSNRSSESSFKNLKLIIFRFTYDPLQQLLPFWLWHGL